MTEKNKKIHPHKFTLWIALGSIVMMFAGLTSAYIVKSNQPNWVIFRLPPVFWYSTLAIVLSSLTMQVAVNKFKARQMPAYRTAITVTAALGVLFVVLQWLGFQQIGAAGVKMIGPGSTASGSFVFVIAGLHILHVLGGVVALLAIFFRAFSRKSRNYSATPLEVTATYWHFVDLLWVYLFIFFNWIQ